MIASPNSASYSEAVDLIDDCIQQAQDGSRRPALPCQWTECIRLIDDCLNYVPLFPADPSDGLGSQQVAAIIDDDLPVPKRARVEATSNAPSDMKPGQADSHLRQKTLDLRSRLKAIEERASAIVSSRQPEGVAAQNVNNKAEAVEPAVNYKSDNLDVLMRLCRADSNAPFRKVVYLMRGPPGSGKSTAARKLLAEHMKVQGVNWNLAAEDAFATVCRTLILSTDDFFTNVDDQGVATYNFNPRKLNEYHPKNQGRCKMLMELGTTPLFVDNTCICMWEMREYVQLADSYGYDIQIVDPESICKDAMKPCFLQRRTEHDAKGRAAGKSIPLRVLERMVQNFESLPAGVGSRQGGRSDAFLDSIRNSVPPRDTPRSLKGASHMGLDVEAKCLASLGGINLGPLFWRDFADAHADGTPAETTLLDARCKEGAPWQVPRRWHVGVCSLDCQGNSEILLACEALAGTWYDVEVRALVFIPDNGMLCAEVAISDDKSFASLAPADWTPHVALLSAGSPWLPDHSSDLIRAWKNLAAKSCPNNARCASAADPRVKLYRSVSVCDRTVDICALPLNPPKKLGRCKLRFFQ